VSEIRLFAGLPDGICSTRKSNLGKFWSVLQFKRLANFMTFWSIIVPFRIFYCHMVHFLVILVYFFPYWYVVPRKIWQPWTFAEVSSFGKEKKIHDRCTRNSSRHSVNRQMSLLKNRPKRGPINFRSKLIRYF
jgi:hypothetical protein